MNLRTHLSRLENESIFIIREAFAKRKDLGVLWSMGKDSTVLLHLIKKAFLGKVPFPVIHIDTSYKIPEMIAWRDAVAKRDGLNLIVGQNRQALSEGMGPDKGRLICCGALKTQALIDTVKAHNIKALLLGIRHDEEGSRSKELVVSPRLDTATWLYKSQLAEVWHYYNFQLPEDIHLRIHPLLSWSELDIWEYIQREKLDVIPLYFSRDGVRYRSLGCYPCTDTIASESANVEAVIQELRSTNTSERSGRAQDRETRYAMQELRTAGYM